MTRSAQNVWVSRFAVLLAGATLFLVALGGIVTTKGVGMAVPDWPTTYGHHMFFFPFSQWVAGVFDEHWHRVWASMVGLLTAVLLLWIWCRDTAGRERAAGIAGVVAGLGLLGVRVPWFFVAFASIAAVVLVYAIVRWRRERALRWLAVAAFAGVIIQGVLGGLRVTLDAYGWGTVLGIFHAAVAQLFFLLVGTIALFSSNWWQRSEPAAASSIPRRAILVATLLIFVQLILGAVMRHQHAGLAVPDFPLAYGKLWPSVNSAAITAYNQGRIEAAGEQPITAMHVIVHTFHRVTALLIVAAIVGCAVSVWRRTAAKCVIRRWMLAWLAMVLLQATLGAFTIWSQRKVDVTTAHVAGGALTFLVGWLSFLLSSRKGVETCRSFARQCHVAPKGAELTHA